LPTRAELFYLLPGSRLVRYDERYRHKRGPQNNSFKIPY